MSDTSYEPGSHYDRVTAAWTLLLGDDLHYGLFHNEHEELPSATARLTELVIDAARIRPGAEVLDVGCGTGAPACHLASRYGARVTGITTSAVGVEAARSRARDAGLEGVVVFEQRDGVDNGLPDGSFDHVIALESSHLMRHRERLISECARVLRGGGRLALCDIVLRRPMPFDEVRRLRKPLALLREVFGDARMESLQHYAEMAQANGLVVDEERDLTAETRPTFARWRANAAQYRAEVTESLGASDHQRFLDACAVLEGFWDDGTLGYGLLAAHRPSVRP